MQDDVDGGNGRLGSRTFLLCPNRTFLLCRDRAVNTEKRVFYSDHRDKITNYNVTVPGKPGNTCSTQVTFSAATPEAVAKTIALSVAAVK
jgi:hypothetical protein